MLSINLMSKEEFIRRGLNYVEGLGAIMILADNYVVGITEMKSYPGGVKGFDATAFYYTLGDDGVTNKIYSWSEPGELTEEKLGDMYDDLRTIIEHDYKGGNKDGKDND